MSDFKRLHVWQRAHALVLLVHAEVARMRGAAHTALRSQMTRAAMSVAANIVEGRDQSSEREFARFLRIALSSTTELEYHLIVARDTGTLSQQRFETLLAQTVEVRKMLHGLIRSLS